MGPEGVIPTIEIWFEAKIRANIHVEWSLKCKIGDPSQSCATATARVRLKEALPLALKVEIKWEIMEISMPPVILMDCLTVWVKQRLENI